MTTEMFITAVGSDRPGVVAGIAAALAALDANLEDTSMSVLGGRFAMVLLVAVPDGMGPDEVEAALAEPAAALGLDVSVHHSEGGGTAPPGGEPWNITVYGADRPGIVHRVAVALADIEVNIVDLSTRVIGAAEHPVYAMLLDVVVPPSTSAEVLRARLDETASELGIECSLHHVDVDIL